MTVKVITLGGPPLLNGMNGNRDEKEAEPKSRRMACEVVVDESLKGPTYPVTIRDESEDDEVESHDGASEVCKESQQARFLGLKLVKA